jgi:hypothetical protein
MVPGAEDKMNNDLAERLRLGLENAPNSCPDESRFQRWSVLFDHPWGVAPGWMAAAPSALNRYTPREPEATPRKS